VPSLRPTSLFCARNGFDGGRDKWAKVGDLKRKRRLCDHVRVQNPADHVEKGRIKLTKNDSGVGHQPPHHHFIDMSLVADIEGNKVRLSANGNVAVTMEQH
jgi:hypothetical protein